MALPSSKSFDNKLSLESRCRKTSLLETLNQHFDNEKIIFFGSGLPSPDLFPWKELKSKFYSKSVLNTSKPEAAIDDWATKTNSNPFVEVHSDAKALSAGLQYGNAGGRGDFLEFVKEHVKLFHELNYSDWGVAATAGTTQAWETILRIFCDRGDSILAETFSYPPSLSTAQSQGVHIHPVPMDENGVIPQKLQHMLENWQHQRKLPKLFYIIPTGQNPTGSTLSNERRKAIYKIAEEYDILIVEDEPYYFLQMESYIKAKSNRKRHDQLMSEYKRSLKKSFLSLDVSGRVIRLDSLSKILAPACRLGWIVASEKILLHYLNLQAVSIQAPSGFSQMMVLELFKRWGQDGYARWLMQLSGIYRNSRDVVCDALIERLPSGNFVQFTAPTAGMFFTIHINLSYLPHFDPELGAKTYEDRLYNKFLEDGVLLVPGSWFTCSPDVLYEEKKDTFQSCQIFFRGSFATVSFHQLEEGAKRIGDCLGKMLNTA
ncbi:LAMI_0A00474g1_1 [Lachancea mirantina]|uniref:LAMI_0A00474g1_1 n=1 Tax=Lachancea mirantina TaxID=1230905 RepID=A0A1G4IL88_9SACH|nr:LAMI_0A00474g1_1 [Lachancea mirantina]